MLLKMKAHVSAMCQWYGWQLKLLKTWLFWASFNSNVTFISELLYFLWKLKTLKKQGVSFLLETKHKGFFLF